MRFKNVVLGIGIVIVFALVLWQGIEAFYPSPQYDHYCNVSIQQPVNTPSACEAEGGKWTFYPDPIKDSNVTGYCDMYSKCSMEYQDAEKDHSKVVFYIALIVAILAVIAGYAFLTVEPVGSALIGSGIWAIFYGTVVNWRNFSNIWRFLLLLVALVLLIWITLRLNSKGRKN